MKRCLTITILITTCLMGESARADEYQEQVSMGGEELILVRGGNGDQVHHRADRIYERLSLILGDPTLRTDNVRIVWIGDDCLILVKGRLLVTVTADDARRNETTIALLSQAWIARLRQALLLVNVPSERIQRISWVGDSWRIGRNQLNPTLRARPQ